MLRFYERRRRNSASSLSSGSNGYGRVYENGGWAILFVHGAQRQYRSAVILIQDLCQAGIYGGQPADNAFVTGYFCDNRTAGTVADSQQEEEYRQAGEDELQSAVKPQRGDEHYPGEYSPHDQVGNHGRSLRGDSPPHLGHYQQADQGKPEKTEG
jgi:hypothetical protein